MDQVCYGLTHLVKLNFLRIEVNIFKNAADTDCTNVCHLNSVFKGIRSNKWKDLVLEIRALDKISDKNKIKKLKERLPAVIFSGIFEERTDKGILHYNQLMVLDIDKLSYRKINILKEKLKSNPWVYAFFESPSRGLKVLVFIDSEELMHREAFKQIEDKFFEFYNVKIDPSGKNPSRLCFVSWDPDMYINETPFYFHVEEPKRNNFLPVNSSVKTSHGTIDARDILNIVVKMVTKSRTGSYHKGNRNNFVFVSGCLMCEFGVPEDTTISLLADRFQSLEHKEVITTIRSAYSRAGKNFGTKTIGGENSNQIPLL